MLAFIDMVKISSKNLEFHISVCQDIKCTIMYCTYTCMYVQLYVHMYMYDMYVCIILYTMQIFNVYINKYDSIICDCICKNLTFLHMNFDLFFKL